MSSQQQSPTAQPALQLRGIGKSFGPVRALSGVDLDVYRGQVIGLVGDNGAGKSTLVKTIAGVGPADEGQIFVEGRPVNITSPQAATHLGIATVYQDLALCDNLDVVANLFLGTETHRMFGVLSEIEMERHSLEVLRSLNVKLPSVRTIVSSLSGGQRQSVAVARAILGNAKIVLLDEPTAALGVAQTRQVLQLIRRLRENGLAVIVISHNMVDIMAVADQIAVMRLGRKSATFDARNTSQERIIAAITGADLGEMMQPTSNNGNGAEGYEA
ncbi:MAG TPA: ATP-binding cassette domain-containing protein [Ktedonobacteraceae bacterium]|jgi:D-xylose transport system ATP-binding protein|nr:ATP-binding cassette domain-containing protein [Ktedonobacteraceae bacterium]